MAELCECGLPTNAAKHITDLGGATLGNSCGAHLHPYWAEQCAERFTVLLREKLTAATRRIEELEREARVTEFGKFDIVCCAAGTSLEEVVKSALDQLAAVTLELSAYKERLACQEELLVLTHNAGNVLLDRVRLERPEAFETFTDILHTWKNLQTAVRYSTQPQPRNEGSKSERPKPE